MTTKQYLVKWLKWEFWPYWFFYLPIYFYWIWLSIKAKSLTFFTLANPSMFLGGFVGYSKYESIKQIPKHYQPKTIFFQQSPESAAVVLKAMEEAQIQFPIILKPDKGERGFNVEKIDDESALTHYFRNQPQEIILQEYINLPTEFGIMYHKIPNQTKANIHSIVQKEFLVVKGNGKDDLKHLIENEPRCLLHQQTLLKKYQDALAEIIPNNEYKILVEIGNHSRGTTFLNANHLINEQLVHIFEQIVKDIPEFYFGRFDIRAENYQQLLEGNFKIIEINGVNSEPAHIYDPHYRLLNAYKDLLYHWHIIYLISQQNHQRGFPYPKFTILLQTLRKHFLYKKMNKINLV
ncbi:MAG: D-alanine--D-alanine ligase [Cytophagales bacterium]|nr:MAG: D-alanine--D-alanine ligase [Cytophagales bacterium]